MTKSMYLNIISRCNQNCRFCFNDFHGFETKTTEEIKSCIHEGYNENLSEIQLTGGEPTLHKGITYIISFCRKK